MIAGYVIAGIIVLICIGALIFAFWAFNETRDFQIHNKEEDNRDRPKRKSKRSQ